MSELTTFKSQIRLARKRNPKCQSLRVPCPQEGITEEGQPSRLSQHRISSFLQTKTFDKNQAGPANSPVSQKAQLKNLKGIRNERSRTTMRQLDAYTSKRKQQVYFEDDVGSRQQSEVKEESFSELQGLDDSINPYRKRITKLANKAATYQIRRSTLKSLSSFNDVKAPRSAAVAKWLCGLLNLSEWAIVDEEEGNDVLVDNTQLNRMEQFQRRVFWFALKWLQCVQIVGLMTVGSSYLLEQVAFEGTAITLLLVKIIAWMANLILIIMANSKRFSLDTKETLIKSGVFAQIFFISILGVTPVSISRFLGEPVDDAMKLPASLLSVMYLVNHMHLSFLYQKVRLPVLMSSGLLLLLSQVFLCGEFQTLKDWRFHVEFGLTVFVLLLIVFCATSALQSVYLTYYKDLEEMMENQGKLYSIMDNLGVPVVIIEKDLSVGYSNQQFSDFSGLLGESTSSLLSKPCFIELAEKNESEFGQKSFQKASDRRKSLLELSQQEVQGRIFQVVADTEAPSVALSDLTSYLDQDNAHYVQIIVREYIRNGELKIMMQLVDVSRSLLYNRMSAQREFLNMINSTISHETKNPLNSILNQNLNLESIIEELRLLQRELVVEGPTEDPALPSSMMTEVAQALDPLIGQLEDCYACQESSSKLLSHQIACMMDFASIYSSKFKENASVFDIREAIKEQVKILEKQASIMGNEVSLVFNGFDDFLIHADKERIQQIFLNIYSNAQKFTEKGRIIVSCSKVSLRSIKNPTLEISVSDTGVGISPAQSKRLFKLFCSLEEANTQGIGLGLFMSRILVEQFGGQIDVNSKEGEGSDFFFTLPLKEIDQEFLDSQAQMMTSVSKLFAGPRFSMPRLSHSRRRFTQASPCFGLSECQERPREPREESSDFPQVLIVDDQVFNLEAIKVILRLSKVCLETQVDTAYNGVQAVEKVKARPSDKMFDIIFMDCNMPYKDGPTATAEIRMYIDSLLKKERDHLSVRETLKQPLIVGITGHTEDSYVKEALEKGMDQVLGKPANTQKIQQVLQQAQSSFVAHQIQNKIYYKCRESSLSEQPDQPSEFGLAFSRMSKAPPIRGAPSVTNNDSKAGTSMITYNISHLRSQGGTIISGGGGQWSLMNQQQLAVPRAIMGGMTTQRAHEEGSPSKNISPHRRQRLGSLASHNQQIQCASSAFPDQEILHNLQEQPRRNSVLPDKQLLSPIRCSSPSLAEMRRRSHNVNRRRAMLQQQQEEMAADASMQSSEQNNFTDRMPDSNIFQQKTLSEIKLRQTGVLTTTALVGREPSN